MSVRGLTINATLKDGSIASLGSRATRLRLTEGRTVSSWYDQPSKLKLDLQVTDDFIAEDDRGQYSVDDIQGSAVSVSVRNAKLGGFSSVFDGIITSVDLDDPTVGIERKVHLEAYSLDEHLTGSGDILAEPQIAVTRVGNLEIPLDGIVGNPHGMGFNDSVLFIADDESNDVHAWNISDSTRNPGSDFSLTPANSDPVGLTTDTEDLIWVVDRADRRAYCYSAARRHLRSQTDDKAFTSPVDDIGWVANGVAPGSSAELLYRSGAIVRRQDNSELLTLNASNTEPQSIIVSDYLDDGQTRFQIAVWDKTDKKFYLYRGITEDYWTRDEAKDWSFGASVPDNADASFEALDRIWVPVRFPVNGSVPKLPLFSNGDTDYLQAYSIAAVPVRDSDSDISLAYDVGGEAGFQIAFGGWGGVAQGYSDKIVFPLGGVWVLQSPNQVGVLYNSSLYEVSSLGFTVPTSDVVVSATSRRVSLAGGFDSRNIPARFYGGHLELLGVDGDKRLQFGAALGNQFQAPPVTVGDLKLQDSAGFPSNVTMPEGSEYLRYALSDKFILIADLIADAEDSSGFKNVVSVYQAGDGTPGPFVRLEISGASGAIVAMYWARDRLFIRFGSIKLTAVDTYTVSEGSGSWFCYDPQFTTIYPWSYHSDLTPPNASINILSTVFDGIYYRLLDTGLKRVVAYTSNASRIQAQDIVLTGANASPVAITTDRQYLYVADTRAKKVFVYRLSDGEYTPVLDIALASSVVRGMAYDRDNGILYVGQANGAHAYKISSDSSKPEYFSARDIPLPEVPNPSGGTCDGVHLWISSSTVNRLYAYDISTLKRDADFDIPPAADTGGSYAGLANDNESLYVLSGDDNMIYAFDKTFRNRTPAKDFRLFDIAGSPQAISIIGSNLYAAVDQAGNEYVYIYNIAFRSTIDRPRETTAQRWKALSERYLSVSLPDALDGGRVLPAKGVEGSIRDTLRRCIDAELGRISGNQLIPRGSWADNPYDMGSSDLSIDNASLIVSDHDLSHATPVNTPERRRVDSLLLNQLAMADNTDSFYHLLDEDSSELWGVKDRRVSTDASFNDTVALADWTVDHWDSPYTVLLLSLDLVHESEEVATAAILAKPHTPVTVSYTPVNSDTLDENPWLVLYRTVTARPLGDSTIGVRVDLILISPRQYGIGWTLGGSERLIEDRLGIDTIAVKGEY